MTSWLKDGSWLKYVSCLGFELQPRSNIEQMSSQVEPKTGCSPFIGNEAEFIQWMPKIHFCPSIHWSAANLKDTAGANVSALCICQLWCNVHQPYLGCCIFWHEWCGKGTVVTQIEICPIGRQCVLTVTLSHLTLGLSQPPSLTSTRIILFMGSLNIQLASDSQKMALSRPIPHICHRHQRHCQCQNFQTGVKKILT